MNTLLHSPLIDRLGWVLLHSLWQIAAIATGLAFCRLVFRSPQARHLLAMLALVACVAWPAAGFWQLQKASPPLPKESTSPLNADVKPAEERQGTSGETSTSNAMHPAAQRSLLEPLAQRTILQRFPRLLPLVAGAWLAGVALLTLRHLAALWALYRLRTRDAGPAPAAILDLARGIESRLGLRRRFRVLVSARVWTPMVIGTLRPVVLLPASVLTGFSPDQIEALLAHELAHLRRWDDVLNLLQCAIETLLFFHPAVWWISRRARDDRELCADDLATARGIERHTLAQALGRLALDRSPALALAATGHMPVLDRIRRLLLPPPAPMRLNAWPLVTLLVLVSGLGVVPRVKAEAPPRGRILDRNGVVLAESPAPGQRRYPKQTMAAHVLGYVGISKPGSTDLSGRAGIEQSQDKTLAAKQDVQLTLDADIQAIAEKALQQHARNGGAAVVIDPNTGDILALASNPTFNLNEFVPRISPERFEALTKEPNHPLMPRATLGAYFPGSTFKLVTSLAALKSGAIDGTTKFDSPPDFKIGDRVFHNWHREGEGMMSLVGAIKRSCNTWFYQAALKTGSEPITDMAADLGFGLPTGLPLQEGKGFLPTDAYYQQTQGHKMLPGILVNIAIGQVVTATPLQTAIATAAIGNGGKVLVPRLIKDKRPPQYRTDLIEKGLKPEHLDLVKQGMIAVVQSEGGTGHNGMVEGITVAGKTGTAQWMVNDDDSKNRWLAWFTAFAPADNPKIAIAVVYEGGFGEKVSGGSVAAPIAQEIMKGTLEKLKAVSWIDALDQQWIETASRLEVPQAKDMVVLYHPSEKNLAPGPIHAGDIVAFDSKNPKDVFFYHGDGKIVLGTDGKATIDADKAVTVTSVDALPDHWQRMVKGQPPKHRPPVALITEAMLRLHSQDKETSKHHPPPSWINEAWFQSAKTLTMGEMMFFYRGEMTHTQGEKGAETTTFQGDVVMTDKKGALMASQHGTVKLIVGDTINWAWGGQNYAGFVEPGELPALDAAIEKLKQGKTEAIKPTQGSASSDSQSLPDWLTNEWIETAKLTTIGGTSIHSSGVMQQELGDTVIIGAALFRDQQSKTWRATTSSTTTLRFRSDGLVVNGLNSTQQVSTRALVPLLASMSGKRQLWRMEAAATSKKLSPTPGGNAEPRSKGKEQSASSDSRRTYSNPWPFGSFGPADVLVSSDGRSYDYAPGAVVVRPPELRLQRPEVEYEPLLWAPLILPSYTGWQGNTSASDLLRLPDSSWRPASLPEPEFRHPASKTEPHLIPSGEKFQLRQLPQPPESPDALLSEPKAPKLD